MCRRCDRALLLLHHTASGDDIRGDLGGEGRGVGIVVDDLVLLQGVAVNVVPAGRPVEEAGLVPNQTGLCTEGAELSHRFKRKME